MEYLFNVREKNEEFTHTKTTHLKVRLSTSNSAKSPKRRCAFKSFNHVGHKVFSVLLILLCGLYGFQKFCPSIKVPLFREMAKTK